MRLFYSDCIPREKQSRPELTSAIPYERLTKEVNGRSPYASGDYGSHRSIYGGAYALWWGELVKATEDPYILQMDLSRSDFLCAKAHPSYLYYNPWNESKQITLALEGESFDLYDLSAHAFIGEHKSGRAALTIPANSSRVIVVVPSGARRRVENGSLLCDGVPVDYQAGAK